MPVFISIQHHTGGPSHCNKVKEKMAQISDEEVKLLFADYMFILVKKYRVYKIIMTSNHWIKQIYGIQVNI